MIYRENLRFSVSGSIGFGLYFNLKEKIVMFTRKAFGSMLALAMVLALSMIGCAGGAKSSGGGASSYGGMSPEGKFVSAAVYGDIDVIIELLDEGVDINTLGSIRRPALTLAAYNGHMDIVKLLVEKGADLDMTSGNSEETAVIMATKLKEAEVVKFLVESGADVNIADLEGRTALNYANETDQSDLAAFLVGHGAVEGSPLSEEEEQE